MCVHTCVSVCVCDVVVVQSETETQWGECTGKLKNPCKIKTSNNTEAKLCGCWLAWDPSDWRASMTLNWRGSVRSELEGKTRRHFEKELDWVTLLQVQILAERRHHSKHVRALASVRSVSLAHSLHYLTHGNPLINPPHFFPVKWRKRRVYYKRLGLVFANPSSDSSGQLQHKS